MIRIVTDSMSDISQQEAENWGITVVPLSVRFGEEEYLDGVEMDDLTFFHRLSQVKELPKTSQVPPERFKTAFRHLLDNNEDEILCITGSSGLSGTYQSAVLAREMSHLKERIVIVDSLSASVGEAMLVWEAIRCLPTAESAAQLGSHLEKLVERNHLIGCFEELKYLVMGGRLHAALGKVGTSLHIKPLLRMTDGKLHQVGFVRSLPKGRQWYLDRLEECPPDPAFPIMIAGAMCDEEVALVKEAIEGSGIASGTEILCRHIGAVIGTYVGPNMTTLAWVAKE